MFNVSKNNIITITRGDTFILPVYINIGTAIEPCLYKLEENDALYFALLEPNQKWENALLKKKLTSEDAKKYCVNIEFCTEDTEYLVPGNYYYEIKLFRSHQNTLTGKDQIDTIIPRTKFVILE